ncbi:hypothetical protein FIBSPDRAFT_862415 [Athelia psychrophila]|uniref:Uncharacterized protein n=1 Tax=Athelia psychrophila TaxID=1759441 RepID=A0A166IE50_9AGAM|nr:hypothetical protein FIBSPDRAFT_862415 [Fibularhizoctonia sp. CBS 109695]
MIDKPISSSSLSSLSSASSQSLESSYAENAPSGASASTSRASSSTPDLGQHPLHIRIYTRRQITDIITMPNRSFAASHDRLPRAPENPVRTHHARPVCLRPGVPRY